MKTKTIDILSYGLLALAVIGTMVLLGVNIARADEPEQTEYAYDVQTDSTMFYIENVLDTEELGDHMGYAFIYALDDTTFIEVTTSNFESDYLQVYLDCWETYMYYQSEEDLDGLRSYLINNSRIEYEDDQYYQGYVWYYDACPMYRFERY